MEQSSLREIQTTRFQSKIEIANSKETKVMEENISKELPPSSDKDSPVSMETGHENRIHSISPESLSVDNTISPVGNEVHVESQRTNLSEGNLESSDRQTDRENNNNESLDQDVLIQRHPDLPSAIVSLESESMFSCKFPGCNFTSVDAEEYLKHEDTHVEGGAVSCDVCNFRFATYANMRRHHLYVHQGIRTFECQFCSKRFLRKEQFMEHLLKHTKPHQCSICGGSFSVRGQLKSHLANDHSSGVLRNCNACGFKTSSPTAIKIHYATTHLKQHIDLPSRDQQHEIPGSSHVQANYGNTAIDLAAVSQNFSLIASHYPTYSAIVNNGPGPSDLSHRAKIVHLTPSVDNQNSAHIIEPTVIVPRQENRHACVSSVAGSSVVSPSTISGHSSGRPEALNIELVSQGRICVKPEPLELNIDGSQNNNVHPTSTIDLSNSEVVETTSSHETLNMPCRRKVHKYSATDDVTSEGRNLPGNIPYDFQSAPHVSIRNAHTCCRYRPYEEGNQRCRDFTRHTCSARRQAPERRSRFSDSDVDRNAPSNPCDNEEHKVFSRATSTHAGDISNSRTNSLSAISCRDGRNMASESNYFVQKNGITIRDVESCTLTCAYCGIIFPDQTLYLLHRSLHSEGSPWKCNLCGKNCKDKYDFNSHIISKGHY